MEVEVEVKDSYVMAPSSSKQKILVEKAAKNAASGKSEATPSSTTVSRSTPEKASSGMTRI
jgi:hypothetical protein